MRIASGVFRTDVAALTLQSGPNDVPGWDSFSHVTLLLSAEGHFGVDIAADHATDIGSLGDLVAVIAARKALSPS
jgi:acyl carrier protein